MRKWAKWMGIIFLIPVLLVWVVSILLYIPPFQNYVVKKVTAGVSEATGMHIHADRIRLSFPLDVSLRGVEVVSLPADTLLALGELSVRVNPLLLLRKVVSVETVRLREARFDTGTLIDGMKVSGVIGNLSARANPILPADGKATLNDLKLSDAAVTLVIDSLSKKDTASTPVNWVLDLRQIALEHVCFALQMPADSLYLKAYLGKAGLKQGLADLGASRYAAGQFSLDDTRLEYDSGAGAPSLGLDPSHIALDKLHTVIESIVYQGREMAADIRSFSVEERSGLAISSLEGTLKSDNQEISVPRLVLRTPDSEASLLATIPWGFLDGAGKEEKMEVALSALLGKNDLFKAVGNLPEEVKKSFPDAAVDVSLQGTGNGKTFDLRKARIDLPGVFNLTASGKINDPADNLRRSAEGKIQARTQQTDFLLAFLPKAQREQFRLPPMQLSGELGLKDREYKTDLLLTEGMGRVRLDARYHTVRRSYRAELKVDSLEPVHFMPNDSLKRLSADILAKGEGTDLFARQTWLELDGRITRLLYGSSFVKDVVFSGSLKEHQAQFKLNSDYPLADMDVTLDGVLTKEEVKGMLIAEVDSLDLYRLHLTGEPLATSFQLFAQAESNLLKRHRIDVSLGNWTLTASGRRYNPKILTLLAHTDEDTTRLSFHAGDLGITLTAGEYAGAIVDKTLKISDEITGQLQRDTAVNIAALRPLLPEMKMNVTAGNDNPVYNIMQQYRIGFSHLQLAASASPGSGLLMDAGVYALHRDTFLIDTVRASIRPDSTGLIYQADVHKNKYMQQTPFTASVHGSVGYRHANAEILYTNDQGETGLQMGIEATKEPEGFGLHFYPEKQIIAFTPFTLNPDNYVRFRNPKEIYANLRFSGTNDAALWFHSEEEEGGAYPELHAELSQIDLGVLSQGFAQLPAMQGIFNGDIRYAPTEESFLVVADANVDNLIYNRGRVGGLLMNAVYLPLENGEHQVDVHLSRDEREVAAGSAVYSSGRRENIEGFVDVAALPLDMATPFIPDGMASLGGVLNGRMEVAGSADAPRVNGYLQLDTGSVYVAAVNAAFRFDDRRIEVKDSRMAFDRFQILAANNNPFVINGYVDFSNLSRMTADLQMNADNMQLLDAERTSESLVYGKILANVATTLKGPLNRLSVRGNIRLLGGTDAGYILVESPLTVQDRLKDLVSFTSFTDTVIRMQRRAQPLPLSRMDVLLVLNIDPAVQFRVDLTPDQSSYVEIEGGGDLSFQYNSQGDMVLNGRYTFADGNVNYKLPVIPLKKFRIVQDSYVQWDGDMMNPLLNVQATERMRVSAKAAGESSTRMVYFDVGLDIRERLDNMNLNFTISAPQDTRIQNELASMGAEERAKQAVAMMVTGSYLYGGGDGMNLDVNSALNSFLTSEINNIAGDALKTVDISFGMDAYEQDGSTKRDFSLQFAKRFYNDRLRVVVGGKVSTGDVQETEPFIDNVSLEYRLDQAGTKNVKIFHDRNYESLLEGEILETGAGIVFRKKMLRLRELFDFRRRKENE